MSIAPDLNVLKCPQCNAPITPPSRFARSAVCGFCGSTVQVDPSSVRSARFKEAFREQNQRPAGALTLGNAHWMPGPLIARGELSDVYLADRTRTPSERVVLKILRDDRDAPLIDHEWEVLSQLQKSGAPGASTMTLRIPQPVAHGKIAEGPHAGRPAIALRYERGFDHTVEQVHGRYPNGVDARAAVWVWRRILETLAFMHQSGISHGAILPNHLLIQRHEHGVRLVGYSCAFRSGFPLNLIVERFEAFYPSEMRTKQVVGPAPDLQMAARCIAYLLGGDPATGEVPATVPAPLAYLVRSAASDDSKFSDAWRLREYVGTAGRHAFGAPSFNPIVMP